MLGGYEDPHGNHLLQWVEGDRGFSLQVLGPLPEPAVLVGIAEALVVPPGVGRSTASR